MASAEIEAMGAIEDAFVELDDETRVRVLGWAYAKYAAAAGLSMGRSPQQIQAPQTDSPAVLDELDEDAPEVSFAERFQHFAELYDCCSPRNRQDRFVVAAYWLQVKGGKESFGNAEINKLLKDQGQENSNLNKVVDSLRSKTPRLVIQLAGGAADKTRRVLKLTQPGIKAVEEMAQNGA